MEAGGRGRCGAFSKACTKQILTGEGWPQPLLASTAQALQQLYQPRFPACAANSWPSLYLGSTYSKPGYHLLHHSSSQEPLEVSQRRVCEPRPLLSYSVPTERRLCVLIPLRLPPVYSGRM